VSKGFSKSCDFWRRLGEVLVVLVRYEVHSRNQDERLVEEEEDNQRPRFRENTPHRRYYW
jgi:hypothetical protein